MKQITENSTRLRQTMARWLILCAAVSIWPASAIADNMNFYDWNSSFTGSGYSFDNTSSAGTITGSSPLANFYDQPGTFGVPTAITSQIFTEEFQVSGQTVGASATFNFSSGYAWGTGGELILGNIHNYFQYTLSAWDSSGNPIDVNTAWTVGTEYPSTAPGTMGYFSTSSTQESASGNSENFFVDDPTASADGGQGGVLTIDGLLDVGEIQLALTSSSLGPNAQQVDFILFNVGTPAVPEPSSLALLGGALACVGLGLRHGRKLRRHSASAR